MYAANFLSDDAFRLADALLDDDTADRFEAPTIDGHKRKLGLKPRDFEKEPLFATANEFPDSLLIPEGDLKEAFELQKGQHATLFDLRNRSNGQLDSLDQNGYSLCWYFSTTKAHMYSRAIANLAKIKLSPWWGAGKINKWADRGGWGQASMKHAAQYGQPLYDVCPTFSKKYDTEEVAEKAKEHMILEYWECSGSKDRRAHQMLSAFARGFCPVLDLNWMGHSMAGCYVSRFNSIDDFDVDCDNSWGMKSGVKGLYRCKGSKARPDDCVIARVAKATDE